MKREANCCHQETECVAGNVELSSQTTQNQASVLWRELHNWMHNQSSKIMAFLTYELQCWEWKSSRSKQNLLFQITKNIKDPKCAINSGRSPTGKKKELKDTSFCKMTIFYNSDNFLQEYSNSLELWCVMSSFVWQKIHKKYCIL